MRLFFRIVAMKWNLNFIFAWKDLLRKYVKIHWRIFGKWESTLFNTNTSLSEALLFAEHGENILCTKIVLNVRNNFCAHHVLPRFELGIFMYWTWNSMNNLSSYCGLVDAKKKSFWQRFACKKYFLLQLKSHVISNLSCTLTRKIMT